MGVDVRMLAGDLISSWSNYADFAENKLWQPYFVWCTRHRDVAHQCRPQVRILRAKLASPESVHGCNRGGLWYSQPARYAPQTWWNSWRHETLHTNDIHRSSLTACKLRTRPYRDETRWYEIRMLADTTWYAMVWKWTFVCTMWYALVWKWMFACTHTICFGVQNECSHMLYNMIWCDKRLFACTTRNALVWKWMFPYTHTICYGVQNVCSRVLYNMSRCNRQAAGNICTGIETNPGRQKA